MGDRFERFIWLGSIVAAVSLIVLFLQRGPEQGDDRKRSAELDKGLQREIAYQSRAAFLKKTFEPVDVLSAEGKHQSALLKLEEIRKDYPAEAHGYILKGRILAELGALEEAVTSYAEGVRLNGDYVDSKSPLSVTTEIRLLAEKGREFLGRRLKENPENPTVAALLKKVHYLESRLAGGCE